MSTHEPLAVLVSTRIDPISGRATRSRTDAAAVVLAQRTLGVRAAAVYTYGSMPDAVGREYLALGITRITKLLAKEGGVSADAINPLASACADHRVVLAGGRAESGVASGLLPHLLAERMQRPIITDVIDIQMAPGGGLIVTRALPRGARQRVQVDAGTAVILATSPRLALRADLPQRHSWTDAQAGRIEQRFVTANKGAAPAALWNIEPARKQRRPLVGASNESGASRMARATGTADSGARGGLVISDGSAEAKAQALLDHLRRLALVQV